MRNSVHRREQFGINLGWERLRPMIAGFVVLALVSLGVGGCLQDSEKPLNTLRIGILPDQSREQLEKRYTLLFQHLSQSIGIPYELVVPRDYGHLLELFHNGEVDLAYFGGFTFVKAHLQDGARPMVMRDVDFRFASYFLAKASNAKAAVADFRGATFGFGSKLSTSGHLMPRSFLQNKGIEPEKFFAEVKYSGGHDKTAHWVRDGVVELGVANASIVDSMFADGRLGPTDVRVVWKTPPYPDYVWALRRGVDDKIRGALTDAFLGLSTGDARQAELLRSVGAGSFQPARVDDFAELRRVAEALNIL